MVWNAYEQISNANTALLIYTWSVPSLMQRHGYDRQFLQTQQQRLTALGGALHYIPYKSRPEEDLWDVAR